MDRAHALRAREPPPICMGSRRRRRRDSRPVGSTFASFARICEDTSGRRTAASREATPRRRQRDQLGAPACRVPRLSDSWSPRK
jgi:hypothetical protein